MIICEISIPKHKINFGPRKEGRKVLDRVKKGLEYSMSLAGYTQDECDLHLIEESFGIRFIVTPLGETP